MDRDDRSVGEQSWNSNNADFSDEEPAPTSASTKVRLDDPAGVEKKAKTKAKALKLLRTATTVKETNIFQDAYEKLENMELDSGATETYQKIRHVIRSNGFERDDPRVKPLLDQIDTLEKQGSDFTFETFTGEMHNNFTLFRKALDGQTTIPDYEGYVQTCKGIFDEVKSMPSEGMLPEYIPELKNNPNPDDFAVSICTVDGQFINLGSAKQHVTMHALSNVVNYLIALEQYGEDELKKYIGSEPSGSMFNALELMETGIPHNPLNCAGGLMSCALIYKDQTSAKKYEFLEKKVKKMVGGKKVSFNNEMFLCELDNAHANYSLLYMLEEHGTLPDDTNVKNTLKFYTQACALNLRVKDYALLGAALANGGICPLTDERASENSESVKLCLSQMLASGMNTQSGKWLFDVGLPAKSSVSGLTMMVVPNTCGICVYSPKLNRFYNSHKADVFLKKFVTEFGYDEIDFIYGAGKMKNALMKTNLDLEHVQNIHLLYQAQKGDLKEIRRSVAAGLRINFKDYDKRTALHLAANHGHFKVVKYLVSHGAKVHGQDRFGNTPLDEARMNGHEEIMKYLEKQN